MYYVFILTSTNKKEKLQKVENVTFQAFLCEKVLKIIKSLLNYCETSTENGFEY